MAFSKEERARYIKEVENWLTYRDTYIGTWWSESQKALLEEIRVLKKQLKKIKEKKVHEK